MARSWEELVLAGGDAGPEGEQPARENEEERKGFFRRLRENMSKTRSALGAELRATVFDELDDAAFERIEEILIAADVGAATTAKIVERLELEASSGELQGGEAMLERLRALLAEAARTEGADTIPVRSSSTRSRRPARAGATSSSATRPAACTPSST
jgi:fused signal recognition particle receptor